MLFCRDADGKRHENFRECLIEVGIENLDVEHRVIIDDEIVDCAQAYVDFVRELVQTSGGQLLVEQRVPIGWITGEKDAGGTSDTIILTDDEITIVDLKGGMGKVVAYEVVKPALPDPITGELQPPVLAPNSQMAMYAGGALHEHELMHSFERVRMIICQPRLNHVSEYVMSVADLKTYLLTVSEAAEATRSNPTFSAGDHCGFCKGRETCQARTEHVLTTALEGFGDTTNPADIVAAQPRQTPANLLGAMFGKLPMIEQWCKDIAGRVYEALQAGEPVVRDDGIGYKLVAGKRGHRSWDDPVAVEAMLKNRMRLRDDQMYDFSLISPTTAQKLATPPKVKKGEEPKKPVIGDRQWTTLSNHIKQADGKPAIALETDPRPALQPVVCGFEDTSSQPAADTVDYFN